MSKACVCGDPVSLCLKGKKKWYSLLRTNRKQKETDVFKCILPIKDFDCKMVPVNVFLGSGRLWPSQHAVCAEEKETCQAEDHVNIHPGGGRPKHCALRSCSKTSFRTLTCVLWLVLLPAPRCLAQNCPVAQKPSTRVKQNC